MLRKSYPCAALGTCSTATLRLFYGLPPPALSRLSNREAPDSRRFYGDRRSGDRRAGTPPARHPGLFAAERGVYGLSSRAERASARGAAGPPPHEPPSAIEGARRSTSSPPSPTADCRRQPCRRGNARTRAGRKPRARAAYRRVSGAGGIVFEPRRFKRSRRSFGEPHHDAVALPCGA